MTYSVLTVFTILFRLYVTLNRPQPTNTHTHTYTVVEKVFGEGIFSLVILQLKIVICSIVVVCLPMCIQKAKNALIYIEKILLKKR